jgi:ectoine hydroxylase-related dioxygenase (phytanoyl-CoA dioxygenase family)
MPYPRPTAADVEHFDEHGWIVVRDAIDPDDLVELEEYCSQIIDRKELMAYDWAWEEGKATDEREFKILQSSPTLFWPVLNESRFRHWAVEFGSALLRRPVEFWYDQFLAKPPETGATTLWHQDEGYWGRNLDDRGITCWMPFHDVDESNGCMHFIDGGHRLGVLEHRNPDHIKSDLLYCEPDESEAIACPIALGDVTFHHSKTPHMTTPNTSGSWRRILTQHLRVEGSGDEGDHYPWKIIVNQFTGERVHPTSA